MTDLQLREAVERCESCDLAPRVTRLEQAVFGDDDIGLRGLRKEVGELNTNVRSLLARWDRIVWVIVGFALGGGLGGGVLGTLFINAIKAAAVKP